MIVDASVAFKWIAVEEDSPAAIALLARQTLGAPTLLLMEVANGLWKQAVREQIDPAIPLDAGLADLATLVSIRDETPVIERAFGIARTLIHPVYDCVYLAMAEAEDVPLVTADKRFLGKLAGSPWESRVIAFR